jgi:hypothetical protein
MDNKVRPFAIHESSLLAIHSRVSVVSRKAIVNSPKTTTPPCSNSRLPARAFCYPPAYSCSVSNHTVCVDCLARWRASSLISRSSLPSCLISLAAHAEPKQHSLVRPVESELAQPSWLSTVQAFQVIELVSF